MRWKSESTGVGARKRAPLVPGRAAVPWRCTTAVAAVMSLVTTAGCGGGATDEVAATWAIDDSAAMIIANAAWPAGDAGRSSVPAADAAAPPARDPAPDGIAEPAACEPRTFEGSVTVSFETAPAGTAVTAESRFTIQSDCTTAASLVFLGSGTDDDYVHPDRNPSGLFCSMLLGSASGFVRQLVFTPDGRGGGTLAGTMSVAPHGGVSGYFFDGECPPVDRIGSYVLGPVSGEFTATVSDGKLLGSGTFAHHQQPVTVEVTATQTSPLPRHGLCPEIDEWLGWFSEDDLVAANVTMEHSGITVDGEFIQEDFRQAVRNYNAAHPGDEAFVSYEVPYAGTAGSLQWLAKEGGLNDTISKRYSGIGERDLRDDITQESDRRKQAGEQHRLTPGEVYELALARAGGDAKQAMLLAHNTLRSLARDLDVTYTGVASNRAFFEDYLIPLRESGLGGRNPEAFDNAGPWYHVFGTAYFSMVQAGDVGETASIVGLGAAKLFLLALLPGGKLIALARLAVVGVTVGHILGSRASVTNWLEQYARESRGATPDPEKFCYNVWGHRVGEQLWEELPTVGERSEVTPFSSFPRPETGNVSWVPRPSRFLNYTNSPLSVLVEVDGHGLLFDQAPGGGGDVRTYGDAPIMFVPIAEPDGTWGVVFDNPEGRSTAVTMEVMVDDAETSFVRIDGETGAAALWELPPARAGDRFTIELDDSTVAPDLVGPDGAVVEPTLMDLVEDTILASPDELPDAMPAPTASETSDDRGGGARWIIGILLLVVLVGAGVAVAIFASRRPTSRSGVSGLGPGTWVYVDRPRPLYDAARNEAGELTPGTWYRVVHVEGGWAEVEFGDRRAWTDATWVHPAP